MPSSRRPTYAPAKRTKRPDAPSGNGTDAAAQSSGMPGGAGNDVITASRSIPDQASPQQLKEPKAAGATVLAFPEPKGRRRRKKVLLAVGTVLVLVAGLLAAAVYSPMLAMRTISVTGTRLVTPAQVQAALEPLRGKPLPQISDDDVRGLLGSLIQVKSVSVEARPPSTLAVAVHERVPVALVKQGEQYQLVDVDGIQLATTDDPASASLPVIDGGAGAIGQDLFRATAAVLGALPADVLAKLSNASAQSVDAVELKLVDGQTIVWGNASEKELKAKVLAALLKAPADPKNPVRVYDVSVPRHPVTR
ncbi:cell division protein FtsQ/DivIB [Arthrobacter sp. Soil764]|uniref:cell division protein FtsQ/DivIB n=1 Tax=Arthrobacter sp. Soil764 TaxID=1736403 RepID=UPI0006F45F29|nr:FtsQ-type POTRA domain-containing protein [Arthrobacter sp. Soil764]KRE89990.1 peptidase S33 [Arthrobacter sp. Soil764]